MENDTREARPEAVPLLLPWGIASVEVREDLAGSAAFWLMGGASLLVWTAVALLLTA